MSEDNEFERFFTPGDPLHETLRKHVLTQDDGKPSVNRADSPLIDDTNWHADWLERGRRQSQRLAWVVEHMPEESKLALARFVKVNPAYNGAGWDDCLDVLLDTDSHLDVTEPLAEEDIEMSSEIGVTLLWAYGGNPTADEVRAVLERSA